jgi:hypothetical protein
VQTTKSKTVDEYLERIRMEPFYTNTSLKDHMNEIEVH